MTRTSWQLGLIIFILGKMLPISPMRRAVSAIAELLVLAKNY